MPASTPIAQVNNDDPEAVEEQFHAAVMSPGWDPTTVQVAHPAGSSRAKTKTDG
ncbi:hypothetical protein [Arthrobacter sp. zg-Y238]|uniref:hypothetical protein n=1 Tax=Arthrobacter sp. zg-Y238 TaxID=2964614 RepID=UPI00351CE43D